jgi:hypothetical protein
MFSFLTFKFVLDSSFSKKLKMMSITTIFLNAYAWVYVQQASLISVLVMQVLVGKKKKKNKPSMTVSTGYRLLKKFPMPMPSGLHKWFLKKCPARLI